MKPGFISLLFVALMISCSSDKSKDLTTKTWWTPADRQHLLSELQRTTKALRNEIAPLTDEQWHFREAPDRWSIAEIVEHLEMQNQLHYREISIVANAPQYLQYRAITEGQDQHFSNYATDTIQGQAKWFLEPLGRFCTKEAGENAFYRARGELTKWVEQTPIDLRKQFTFRTPVTGKEISEIKIGQVRDLHQLLLTGIAHTDRHLRQIRRVKQNTNFPRN